jgi:uncharacterized protein involved in tolerance to divalent cations
MHAIISDVYEMTLEEDQDRRYRHLQNVKAPEMMPLATETGNTTYANWVKGSCKAMNSGGGITSLRLKNSQE